MDADTTKDSLIRRRVAVSTVSNYAGKIFSLGIAFLLTPFFLRELGPSVYGLWALVNSTLAYGALLDLGISNAITKYVSEYRARGQMKEAQSLVATGLSLYSALGILIMLLSLGLASLFPLIFRLPTAQHTTAIQVVILAGIGLGISIPCTTTSAVLRGLQRFDIINILNAIGSLLYLITSMTVLSLEGGLPALVAINIPTTLLLQIPAIWFVRRLAPELKFGWRGADYRLVRPVASYSFALFVGNVAGQIQTKTDEIVIGINLAVASVTPYAIARRLSEIPKILTDQFMKVLMPLASQLHAEDDHRRLRALYLTSTRLTLVSFVPLACGLVFLARPFLTIWVGETYANYTYLVLILTAASLIDTSQWPAGSILQGMALHRWLAAISLTFALINLGLSIWLVHPFGLAGVAIGTLIPTTIESFFFVLPYAVRRIGVSWRAVLNEIFLPSILPVIPMAAILYFLVKLFHPETYLLIALLGAIGLVVYAAGYLMMGVAKSERQVLRRIFQNMVQSAQTYFLRS